MTLNNKALLSVFVMIIAMGLVIFIPAGTLYYWQAWLYLFVFSIVALLTTIDLIKNDPELLQRRLRGGPAAEKRTAQQVIMLFTSLAFIGLLVVPGLDRRFGWSQVSPLIVILGDGLVVLGFYFIFRVYRENTYTSATIEVAVDQKVIQTGPYAMVRHPMYASALLYLVGTPLALGSYWGIVPFVVVIPFLIWRLIDEEKMLVQELAGYKEYRQRVRYRLVPGLW